MTAPASIRIARPPATLSGRPLTVARAVWVLLALLGIVFWCVNLPSYYHQLLAIKNVDCCLTRDPAQWRIGLHALGLSPQIYADINVLGQFLLAAPLAILGLVIFLRTSHQWIGLFVSIELLAFGTVAPNTIDPSSYPHWFATWVIPVMSAYSNLAYLGFFLIPLVFPDGRFVPRWTPGLVLLGGVLAAGSNYAPGSVVDPNVWPGALSAGLSLFVVAVILISPVYRYRRISDPTQRQQIRWVVFGLIVAIGLFMLAGTVGPAIPWVTATPTHKVLYDFLSALALGLGFLFLAFSFAVAILRHGLWEINVIINRTLVYGSLTVSLGAFYIGGVVLLQALFRAVTGSTSDLAVAIGTLVVAALFNPWRRRIQSFIDRRFYRRRYDAVQVLQSFNVRLRDEVNLDHLTDDILTVVAETVQPQSATIWLSARRVSS